MHIYFSGIGGSGISSFALIARDAGFTVSGSDIQPSSTLEMLKKQGLTDIHIGQNKAGIQAVHEKQAIDWFVYSDAVAIEQPDSVEMQFCRDNQIPMSQRAGFINEILSQKQLQLIGIAGTHGKSTTTGMMIWLLQQLEIPISYSLGAKIPFGPSGHYQPDSRYFVYEADEFARHFLELHPTLSLITGIDWDHPDIYPTREYYYAAFKQYIQQSKQTVIWQSDQSRIQLEATPTITPLPDDDAEALARFTLPGVVNRRDALQVAVAVQKLTGEAYDKLVAILNHFPGVNRRFEKIIPNLYSDYAHTVPKIQGALQTAEELAPGRVVVVYEGLHNTRQHFIKDELAELFTSVKNLYIVPSYLAREDPKLKLLTPNDLRQLLSPAVQTKAQPALLDTLLQTSIKTHLAAGDVVLCLTAGGGGSLDEWLRQAFKPDA